MRSARAEPRPSSNSRRGRRRHVTARAESTLRRSRYELLPGTGVLAFQQAIAATIATTFVRETRFDPLHEASTEQRLYDRLPGWLDALTQADQVPVEIEFGTMSNRITLERAQVVQAMETLGGDVLRLVQAARPAGTPLRVCVSPRVAAMPGLVDRLKTLRDCTIVLLPMGAAALGALQAAAHIVRPPEAIALVHRLPLSGAVETAPGATASLDHVASDQVLLLVPHVWQPRLDRGDIRPHLVLGQVHSGSRRSPGEERMCTQRQLVPALLRRTPTWEHRLAEPRGDHGMRCLGATRHDPPGYESGGVRDRPGC